MLDADGVSPVRRGAVIHSPTSSICLKSRPACTSLAALETPYEADSWEKEGQTSKVTTTLTTHTVWIIQFFSPWNFPSSSVEFPSCFPSSTHLLTHNHTQIHYRLRWPLNRVHWAGLTRLINKDLNEMSCIKHEVLHVATMNRFSIIASQSRQMKTKHLKRCSVTSLQMQH